MKLESESPDLPISSLSLDLDNKWSYLRVHGDEGWQDYPSYLDVFVPRFLEIMERRGLRVTVFVVGRDASLARNQRWLKAIADAGHEIGNHSYEHQPWLNRYSEAELLEEFEQAETAIESATGIRPIGFRGPGFSMSAPTLEILAKRAYRYDASTLPTFIGPLARAYYFMTASLSDKEKEKRGDLFGSVRDGLRSNRPFQWQVNDRQLLEIPVTTIPIFKVPFHFSYLVYLAMYWPALSRTYFRFALSMCRATGLQPSILMHPLDFMGQEDVSELRFFPGMRLPSEIKVQWIDNYLDMLQSRFRVVTMAEHAEMLLAQPRRMKEIVHHEMRA